LDPNRTVHELVHEKQATKLQQFQCVFQGDDDICVSSLKRREKREERREKRREKREEKKIEERREENRREEKKIEEKRIE
jgi:hypothetical protein